MDDKPQNTVRRPDGLCVRHFHQAQRKQWWCRLCHRSKPKPYLVRDCRSMAEVFIEWDEHKVSCAHLSEVRTHELVDTIFDQI